MRVGRGALKGCPEHGANWKTGVAMSHSTGGDSASSPCTAPASALRTQTQPDNRSALTNSAGRIQRLLLAPFHAGRLALRNRIVFSAHTTNYARDGKPSARHVAYH